MTTYGCVLAYVSVTLEIFFVAYWNHRALLAWIEPLTWDAKDLKIILSKHPCHGKGHLPLNQVGQSPSLTLDTQSSSTEYPLSHSSITEQCWELQAVSQKPECIQAAVGEFGRKGLVNEALKKEGIKIKRKGRSDGRGSPVLGPALIQPRVSRVL